MAVSEFSVIARYFADVGAARPDVELGVGDDAALLTPPSGHDLAVGICSLAEGSHFPPLTPPAILARQGFAVALSHLAASAADPAWLTLSLSMRDIDEGWLGAYSSGLDQVARDFGVRLVGGDTTAGHLCVTLHAHGFVPTGQAPDARGIRPGHLVYLTGILGKFQQSDGKSLPLSGGTWSSPSEPPIAQGLALRGIASGACSTTGGLAHSLGRLLEISETGASLNASALPLAPALKANLAADGNWALPLNQAWDTALCFTLPPQRREELARRFTHLPARCTCIGRVEATQGLRCRLSDGTELAAMNS